MTVEHREREDGSGKALCGRVMPQEVTDSRPCRSCEKAWQRIMGAAEAANDVIKQLRDTGFGLGWINPGDIWPQGSDRGHVRFLDITWEVQTWVPKVSAYPQANPCFVPFVSLEDIASGEDAYGQISTWSRSNYRSLKRDYPQVPWVDVSYLNTNGLGILVSSLLDPEWGADLLDVLCGLKADYPVYDECDLSDLEHEEINESWHQWLRSDLSYSIRNTPVEDVWEWLGDDTVQDLFWEAVSADVFGNLPEHNGLEVCWGPIDELADRFGEYLIKECARIGAPEAMQGQMTLGNE